MKIRKILTRRGMAGFGVAALAAGVLATMPSAANAAASITVDNSSLIFGQVAVGSTKDATVKITNNGTTAYFSGFAPVIVPTVFDPQYSLVGDTCPVIGQDFAAGASCTVTFRFTPTSPEPAVVPAGILAQYFEAPATPPIVFKQLALTLVGNVTCGGLTPTIAGSDGDNDIVGTSGNDVIVGLGGEDTVKADGGNDIVCGGNDGDVLSGGAGRDKLFGDGGSDILRGGKGTDTCLGGPAVDRAKKCEKVGGI